MDDRQKLTEIEQRIYDFIIEYRETIKVSPSQREIGRGVYLSSHLTVAYHIRAMVEKGWLTRCPNKANSICPVMK